MLELVVSESSENLDAFTGSVRDFKELRLAMSWGSGGGRGSCKLTLGLGTSDTISIKVLGEISDNVGLDVEVSTRKTILDCLNRQRDLTKNPHLMAAKEELPTLEICHLEIQTADQVVVNEA